MIPATFTFADGLTISRLGYGAMRLTGQPGNFGPFADWQQGIALLRRASELGIDHIDTARAYGPLDNERLIAEAFESDDALPFIASKGGLEKTRDDSGMSIKRDGTANTLRRHINESKEALGGLSIALYYLHFPDPNVPLSQSIEALAKAKEDGLIERIGLSNISASQLEEALSIAHIDAVQNRLARGDDSVEEQIEFAQACAERGIAFVPHGPLGANPMKQGTSQSPAKAMEWQLSIADNVLLIPGTTSIAHLEENVVTFHQLTEKAA